MIGALLLSMALAADQPAPLTGTLSRMYGHWIVDCELGQPRPDGRIECSASTSIDDLLISASRRGDDITYYVKSEKCPGRIVDGKAPVGTFRKPKPSRLSPIGGYDRILAAALTFKVMVCGSADRSLDADRPNMERAFAHLLKLHTAAEISDAARKGVW